nr:hypothetical protein [Paenibacillus xylanexedens]
MDVEITKEFIRMLNEDEKNTKLNKLFSDEELVFLTVELINDSLDQKKDIEQAIEFTIDSLSQMYVEHIRTRYILYSSCLYKAISNTFNENFKVHFDKIIEIENSTYRDTVEFGERIYTTLFKDIHLYTKDYIFLRKILFEFIEIREAYIRISNRKSLYSIDKKVINIILDDDMFKNN